MTPLSRKDSRAVLRIILSYALFAALWIWLSDSALGLFDLDRATVTHLSTYKGFLFILVTSALLYQLVGRHVRETRRAEEELRRSRGLVDSLVEATSDAIYVKDAGGRYLLANDAALRLAGRPAAELLGRRDPEILPPELAETFVAEDRAVLGEGTARTYEERLAMADGKVRTFLTTKGPVRDGEGRVVAIFGIARDITARKELEEQFRHAQKMEAMGRLAGGVAHDFNNILTAVSGYAALGLAKTLPGDPLHDHFRDILSAGESAAGLTRQLLAFSRKQVMRPEELELNTLVARTEKMLRRLVGAKVRLETSLDPAVAPVLADPSQVEQVLVNLVVNGNDAMPGGGRIAIRTGNLSVPDGGDGAAAPLPPGEYVVLEVEDQGTGMAPDTLERIFEPFFTTKESDKGTGLGLSTVLGIVEQSGGTILVDSEPGRGSVFRVFLPRSGGAGDGRPGGGGQ